MATMLWVIVIAIMLVGILLTCVGVRKWASRLPVPSYVLHALVSGEASAAEIRQRIRGKLGERFAVSAVERVLLDLRGQKLVVCRWEEAGGRARAFYSLTERGERAAAGNL